MAMVRLTHLDGKLPNLALMKLAHWHRANGNEVYLAPTPSPLMWEPARYDLVYGSSIFKWSGPRIRQLQQAFPDAVIGGTGTDSIETVEEVIKTLDYEYYDYSVYPEYRWSIGFTQRGCRLNCGFCVVPAKEGKPIPVNTVWDIWRPGTPRCVVLLDNDFFGQPEDHWRARVDELVAGKFKVNLQQGVNVRLLTPAAAEALASVKYFETNLRRRRLYTAWDNLGQEAIFFRGMEMLREAAIPPRHLMVYMLVGYRPGETMEEVLYRYGRLKNSGCKPYPMVYDQSNRLLKAFQRWVVGRFDEIVSWDKYKPAQKLSADTGREMVIHGSTGGLEFSKDW